MAKTMSHHKSHSSLFTQIEDNTLKKGKWAHGCMIMTYCITFPSNISMKSASSFHFDTLSVIMLKKFFTPHFFVFASLQSKSSTSLYLNIVYVQSRPKGLLLPVIGEIVSLFERALVEVHGLCWRWIFYFSKYSGRGFLALKEFYFTRSLFKDEYAHPICFQHSQFTSDFSPSRRWKR